MIGGSCVSGDSAYSEIYGGSYAGSVVRVVHGGVRWVVLFFDDLFLLSKLGLAVSLDDGDDDIVGARQRQPPGSPEN